MLHHDLFSSLVIGTENEENSQQRVCYRSRNESKALHLEKFREKEFQLAYMLP